MASITGGNSNSILKINAFLGLNENPDGDTTLRPGEFSEMRNFRITQDRHLQIRPGTKTVLDLSDALAGGGTAAGGIRGVWQGNVGAAEHILAAYGGQIWDLDPAAGTAVSRGSAADAETHFFGFGGKVYLLNGSEYLVWDGSAGTGFTAVTGYVPLVQIATSPAGAGTQLEQLNRLSGKRRVQFSPDGTAKVFVLPEQSIDSVDSVKLLGEALSGYTVDTGMGEVTLTSAPAAGVNTLEIAYTKGSGSRSEVTAMRFSELYNGATDTRVFLYGDGTNRTVYSGICYDTGQASAEYFPALGELTVGEANAPITALVRHYHRLLAFKSNSAWLIQYGTLNLDTQALTAAFYVQPVNRQFGNDATGQVKLLENDPLTLDAGSIYQWRSSGSYLAAGENNARRISDKVMQTLQAFSPGQVRTFNIKSEHEFWFLEGGTALILNYANEAWFVYRDLPFTYLLETEAGKYGFCSDGRVVHFSRAYRNDDGAELDCYAATGAMDCSRDWLLKYSPVLYVAMQPETGARVYVTAESDRRSDYPDKLVAHGVANYTHVDFRHFSFNTNRKPKVRKVRMKVKKATFYRLVFRMKSASATATIIETDVLLRYAGTVK